MRRRRGIKNDWLERVFSLALLVPLIILAIFLFYSNWKIVKQKRELSEKRDQLAGKADKLETEKEKLEADLFESETEEYWEERIRSQGYNKPGEEVVVIKKEEKDKISTQPVQKKKSLWYDFLAEIQSFF